jgi:hypothetical protein
MVDPVSALSLPSASASVLDPYPYARTDAVAARITAETRRSADITIVTDDGDRVTISAAATSSVSYDAVGARVSSDGESAEVERVSVERTVSRSLTLSVEGSLDGDELRDIRKVVTLLQKAAARRPHREHGGDRGHHRGTDLSARLEHADLDALSEVTASVSFSRTVTAAAAYQSVLAAAPEPPQIEAAA